MNFLKLSGSLLTTTILFTSVVQPEPALARLDCRVVESVGNEMAESIREDLHAEVAGDTYRISRRKKLVIHSVDRVWFEGCRMRALQSVTLKRRVRRDAHGTVRLGADITDANLRTREVCYDRARVEDVSLSRTLGIGEAVYRWAANRVLPDNDCLSAT